MHGSGLVSLLGLVFPHSGGPQAFSPSFGLWLVPLHPGVAWKYSGGAAPTTVRSTAGLSVYDNTIEECFAPVTR